MENINQNTQWQSIANQSTSTPIPSPDVAALKNAGTKKNSLWWIMIWCGIMFMFLMLLIGWGLIIALNSPSTLQSLGLSLDTIKTLLTMIIIIITMVFLVIGVWLFWFNTYRALTIKEWSKIPYILWAFVWFMLIIFSIAWGAIWYSRVQSFSDRLSIVSSELLIPYLKVWAWNDRRRMQSRIYARTQWLRIIAPANIQLQYNKSVFDALYSQVIPFRSIQNIVIDCWNGQTIEWSQTTWTSDYTFLRSCLYTKRWKYSISMDVSYLDKQTWVTQTRTFSGVSMIDVMTEMNISTADGVLGTNDLKSELVVWSNPVRVNLQTSQILSDLWLTSADVERDTNGDTLPDQTTTSQSFNFVEPGLQSIYYRLPWLVWYGTMRYRIDLRVNPSQVEPCQLSVSQVASWEYRIIMNINEAIPVQSKQIEIIDARTQAVIDTLTDSPAIYKLPWAWSYQVRGLYYTTDNKKWSCSAQWLNSTLQFYYLKTTTDIQSSAGRSTDISDLETVVYPVLSLPSTVSVTITDIVPQPIKPTITATLAWKIINPTSQNTYRLRLVDSKDTDFIITVVDEDNKKSTKTIRFVPALKPIIAKLDVDKKVWFDPLTVRLDASISQINDPKDEVVYFTRDFGDGQKTDNVSQWSITHVYRFDPKIQDGRYKPKVTIKTQKWFEDTIELSDYIIVKRELRQVKIVSPTNPAQRARAWDEVALMAQTDGPVKSVKRDFGDNSDPKSCNDRSCLDTTVTYLKNDTYDIVVTVEYADHPPVTQVLKMRVE